MQVLEREGSQERVKERETGYCEREGKDSGGERRELWKMDTAEKKKGKIETGSEGQLYDGEIRNSAERRKEETVLARGNEKKKKR